MRMKNYFLYNTNRYCFHFSFTFTLSNFSVKIVEKAFEQDLLYLFKKILPFQVFLTLKHFFHLLSYKKKLTLEELNLTLRVGMLLPPIVSLGSNQKLEEIVRDKGLLYQALKLERVELQHPTLVGSKVVLNIGEVLPLLPLWKPEGEKCCFKSLRTMLLAP